MVTPSFVVKEIGVVCISKIVCGDGSNRLGSFLMLQQILIVVL